jgi:hypothetical protein
MLRPNGLRVAQPCGDHQARRVGRSLSEAKAKTDWSRSPLGEGGPGARTTNIKIAGDTRPGTVADRFEAYVAQMKDGPIGGRQGEYAVREDLWQLSWPLGDVGSRRNHTPI